MSSYFIVILTVFSVAPASAAVIVPALREPATSDDSPAGLIRQLADPDPRVRQSAEEKLIRIGASARRHVLEASRSENPAIALRASQVLLKMPWHAPDDPQEVRSRLLDYGQRDEPKRIETLSEIAALPPERGGPVLVRLMLEDPSEEVAWQAAAMLRQRMTHATTRLLRDAQPGPTRSAALAMSGHAWFGRDRKRALALYEQAIESETLSPAYDGGELDPVFDRLCEAAIRTGDLTRAAELRRAHAARVGISREAYPIPVFELFALHARFGPLEGYASDVARFADSIGMPQVLYAIGKIHERRGQAFAARACYDTAAASSFTPIHRFRAAQFLAANDWHDLAERELRAIVASDGTSDATIRARLLWANLCAQRGDDAFAADLYEWIHTRLQATGGTLLRTRGDGQSVPVDVRDTIEFHRFRAARRANDAAAMQKHLDQLIALQPTTSDIILDIVPHLRAIGREDDAKRVFAHAYEQLHVLLKSTPDDPGLQNELAWLCARSGERPQEALELATRAIGDQPENPAYLDTAAEANFRCENIEEAIRLESRALELDPSNSFFREQLARFGAAKPRP